MKYFSVALLTFSLCGFACRKYDHDSHHVKGTAFDVFTQAPIEGAELWIEEEVDGSGNMGYDLRTEGPWSTYSLGNFSFYADEQHKEKVVVSRRLLIEKENVVRRGTGYVEMGTMSNEMAVALGVITDCRINYRFINATPFDANDSVYNIYVERPWGQQVVGSGADILVGSSINETLLSSYYGYGQTILHYTVRKNGVLTQHTDTLVVADPFSCQILERTINY